jgi:hypothetical protein
VGIINPTPGICKTNVVLCSGFVYAGYKKRLRMPEHFFKSKTERPIMFSQNGGMLSSLSLRTSTASIHPG